MHFKLSLPNSLHWSQDKEVAGIIENVYSRFKQLLVNKDERSRSGFVKQYSVDLFKTV